MTEKELRVWEAGLRLEVRERAMRTERDSWRIAAQEQELATLRARVGFLTSKNNSDGEEHFSWVALLARALPKTYARQGSIMRGVQNMVIRRLAALQDARDPAGYDPRDPAERYAHIIRLVKPRKRT